MNGALARIVLRYGAGALFGLAVGQKLAADPDVVLIVGLAIGAAVEAAYTIAKRRGWTL